MAYNEFQYALAVQNFTLNCKKKEAKFLPSSAKPQLPAAAQAGSTFFLSLTKSDIIHQNDKNNSQA